VTSDRLVCGLFDLESEDVGRTASADNDLVPVPQLGPTTLATASEALAGHDRAARTTTVREEELAVDIHDREVRPCNLQSRSGILRQIDVVQFRRGASALFAQSAR